MHRPISFAAIVASALLLVPVAASAQWNNQPYQFSNRGGGGESVGMSMAYRQAILNAELRDSRPDFLVRDRSGALLEVERRGGQAFVHRPVGEFLPDAGSGAGRLGVGGFGFSVSGIGGGFYAMPAAGPVLGTWTGMLSSPSAFRAAWAGLSPASSTSIDAWIGQLDGFEGGL